MSVELNIKSMIENFSLMIQQRSYVKLFTALSLSQSLANKSELYIAMANLYPVIAKLINEGRQIKKCEKFYGYQAIENTIEAQLWDVLLHLNNAYINKIGCDCGKPVDLFSDTNDLNYDHHKHLKFRESAWLHFSAERKDQLMIALEDFVD